MFRILYFIAALILPVIFGWWLFLPIVLLFIYLAKSPYEIVFAGLILDSVYFFGETFLAKYALTLFSLFFVSLSIFLNNRIYWRKVM